MVVVDKSVGVDSTVSLKLVIETELDLGGDEGNPNN